MKTLKNRKPHDEFFKTTFSNRRLAEAYIRRFLPVPLVGKLRLEELRLEQTSYISRQLKPYFSDIVYTCPYNNGASINLAFLFEHKSRPVAYPHIQLLRYILEVWENNIREKIPLQITVPMLFYHGEEKWSYRPFHRYLAGLDPDLERYVPAFDYEFLNIGEWSDEKILALEEAFLINALLVFKHIWDEKYIRANLSRFFVSLEGFIHESEGVNFVEGIFVYLVRSSVFKGVNVKDMVDKIQEALQEPVLSAYDRWRMEAQKEGMEKGRKEQLYATFNNMIKEGFDLLTVARILNISIEEAQGLLDSTSEKRTSP